jgi:hypothetical protein
MPAGHRMTGGLRPYPRSVADPNAPSPDDIAVLDLVQEALLPYPDAAEVALRWGERAGMWFTEVRPRNSRAASFDIAVEDDRTLNITVGRTSFEIFGDVQASLPYLRDVVDAVFAGAVEESGWQDAFARIRTRDGLVGVGAMHLPVPWRLRRVRRYEPYTAADPTSR